MIFEKISEDAKKYAKAKRCAITQINTLKSGWSKYKIGKAGETEQERFTNGYSGEYDDIITLYTSKDPEEVSKMEKDLINEFKYDTKCQNDKDGFQSLNDPMTDRNKQYITYVVFKKKKL